MSFGWSVSDVALLTQLAWKTVQKTRKACGAYDDLTRDVSSLHLVLDRLSKESADPQSSLNRRDDSSGAELWTIASGCRKILGVLDKVLEKYNALGTKERSIHSLYKKIRFGGEEKTMRQLQETIARYTSEMSFYLNLIMVGSQGRIERQMEKAGVVMQEVKIAVNSILAQAVCENNREGSVLTNYEYDDKAVWKEFRSGLVKRGFSSSFLKKHKASIQSYFEELGSSGALDDTEPLSSIEESHSADINRNLASNTADSKETLSKIAQKSEEKLNSDTEESNIEDSEVESIFRAHLNSEYSFNRPHSSKVYHNATRSSSESLTDQVQAQGGFPNPKDQSAIFAEKAEARKSKDNAEIEYLSPNTQPSSKRTACGGAVSGRPTIWTRQGLSLNHVSKLATFADSVEIGEYERWERFLERENRRLRAQCIEDDFFGYISPIRTMFIASPWGIHGTWSYSVPPNFKNKLMDIIPDIGISPSAHPSRIIRLARSPYLLQQAAMEFEQNMDYADRAHSLYEGHHKDIARTIIHRGNPILLKFWEIRDLSRDIKLSTTNNLLGKFLTDLDLFNRFIAMKDFQSLRRLEAQKDYDHIKDLRPATRCTCERCWLQTLDLSEPRDLKALEPWLQLGS